MNFIKNTANTTDWRPTQSLPWMNGAAGTFPSAADPVHIMMIFPFLT